MRYRRLVRDYERRAGNHEAMVYWATVFIMTKRLARYEAGKPPEPRWGGNRQPPSRQHRQRHDPFINRLLACRLTCVFAPCLEREFSSGGFPHVVAGCGVAVL